MPERELQITLKFAKQAAERMARDFHQGERQRIKETSGEQEKSDKAYVRAMKMRLRAQADLAREYDRTVKAYEKSDNRYMESYRRNARLREATFRKEMAVARADLDGLTRHYERHYARVRQHQVLAANAEKHARSQARREERLEDQRDAESSRQVARQRLEFHAKGAKEEAENVRVALKTAEIHRRQAEEADKEGRKGRAAGYRALAEGEVRNAKFAAEESTRHYKMAAQEQGIVTRGQGEVIKRHYKEVVNSAKDASKSATQAVVQGNTTVAASAKKSGQGQRDEIKRTRNALEEQQKEIMKVSTAYTMMRIGAEVGQGIRAAMQGAAESLRESRDHVAEMVRNTEQLRDAMAEILSMQGKPISSAATAEQLGRFAASGLTPQQGVAAQKEFIAQAQGMIGETKEHRMTQGQADELSDFAASMAASQGMEVDSAELLMSTLISKADVGPDGKVDTQAVKEQFARNMGLFRNERGHTGQDVRQAAEAIQKNARNAADVDQLAVMHAAQAQIGPNKSRVHLDALFRGLDQLKDEERDELGIANGMTDQQALDAATRAIPRIAKAEGVSERRVARRFLKDQREVDAFMAHLNEGVRAGFYKKVAGEQAASTLDKAQSQIAGFRQGEAGTAARQASLKAQAEAERASQFRRLTESRRDAALDVIRSTELEQPEGFAEAIATRAGQQFGQGSRFEQETEKIALGQIARDLGNFREGKEFLARVGGLTPMTSEATKARGANLLQRLRDQSAARTAQGLSPEPVRGSDIQARARQIAADRLRRRGVAVAPNARGEAPPEVEREANALLQRTLPRGARGVARGQVNDRRDVTIGGQHLFYTGGVRQQNDAEYGRQMADAAAAGGGDAAMRRLEGAARSMDNAARNLRPAVPPALPAKPHVMRN